MPDISAIDPKMLPAYAMRVLSVLEDAGYKAWIVGGWVRDALKGDPAHDVDITTEAPWQKTERVLRAAGIEVHETGCAHGTVTAVVSGKPIECTTYRTEGAYTDLRHPDSVEFVHDVKLDLARRDFTVNAMAWHPARGLLDPYGGRRDLDLGIIRAVGDPEARFSEDALRILRAVRFCARFGFSLEPATQRALVSCEGGLAHIAHERIGQEMDGILASGRCAWALGAAPSVIKAAIGELSGLDGAGWRRTQAVLQGIEELSGGAASQVLRWAALFSGIDHAPARRSMKRMALGKEVAEPASVLLEAAEPLLERLSEESLWEKPESHGVMARLEQRLPGEGRALVFALAELAEAELLAEAGCSDDVHLGCALAAMDQLRGDARALIAEGAPLRIQELAVSGADVMDALGLAPGPEVGTVMRKLFSCVLAGETENGRDALIACARRLG